MKNEEEIEDGIPPNYAVSKMINFSNEKPILSLACKIQPKTIAVGMANGLSILAFNNSKYKRSDVAIPHIKTNAVVVWSLLFVYVLIEHYYVFTSFS